MAGLFHGKFLGVGIEHQAFTGNEWNFQKAFGAIVCLMGDAIDKRMTLKDRAPYGRKIVSVAQQLGALLRKIVRALEGHLFSTAQRLWACIDLDQTGPADVEFGSQRAHEFRHD